MSPRIAEISQHAVAHELRDKAVEPSDRPDARVLNPPDALPQVLRIEAGRERRRASNSANHDRQVAALPSLRGRFVARRLLRRKDICLNLPHKPHATLAAELGARLVQRTTSGAGRRKRCSAFDTEPVARFGLGPAARTLHGFLAMARPSLPDLRNAGVFACCYRSAASAPRRLSTNRRSKGIISPGTPACNSARAIA